MVEHSDQDPHAMLQSLSVLPNTCHSLVNYIVREMDLVK
jgi:hypothetical protein